MCERKAACMSVYCEPQVGFPGELTRTAGVGIAEEKHLELCESMRSERERSASTLKTTHAIGEQ